FGDKLGSDTGSNVESRGYIGQRQDETGLIYLHARYYDPVLGRFLGPDPVVQAGGGAAANPYAYADNDPVNNSDTSGRSIDGAADYGCTQITPSGQTYGGGHNATRPHGGYGHGNGHVDQYVVPNPHLTSRDGHLFYIPKPDKMSICNPDNFPFG